MVHGFPVISISASRVTSPPLDEKHRKLADLIGNSGSAVVAFSGGVDSTFVLKVAVDTLGASRVLAVTGRSPSVPEAELEDATRLAQLIEAEHLIVDTHEIDNPSYAQNPSNRCYFCKTTLYTRLREIAGERGFQSVFNGTNLDDLSDYRPGLKAADEFGVTSPLADAQLTKAEIRELSRQVGLPTFDKPAGPCLASRIQYGELITIEKLRSVERAEKFLHELGIRECRVRHHDKIARIEVLPADFAKVTDYVTAHRIDEFFRTLGYAFVTLDLRGFRSGSMNELVKIGQTSRISPNQASA